MRNAQFPRTFSFTQYSPLRSLLTSHRLCFVTVVTVLLADVYVVIALLKVPLRNIFRLSQTPLLQSTHSDINSKTEELLQQMNKHYPKQMNKN